MHNTLTFPDLLRLIDERSAAFRAAVAAAPGLDAPVPSCPGWTLLDLVQHIGVGRQYWATIVAAGPAGAPPAKPAPPAQPDLQWVADSTEQLLDALRDAGPDRGCWTWWDRSQAPQTAGAVARHQLQELAVHTYDAQLTAGDPQPLPDQIALDGVEEFLVTCVATTSPWPHEPAILDYHVTEGRSWRLWFSADGARVARLDPGAAGEPAGLTGTGTASDLVLTMYARLPLDVLKLDGDRRILDQLVEWEPA